MTTHLSKTRISVLFIFLLCLSIAFFYFNNGDSENSDSIKIESNHSVADNIVAWNNSKTTATNREQSSTHTVVAGETLYNIARKSGHSVSEIIAWNDLQSNAISVGQTLLVSPPTPTEADNIASSATSDDEPLYHTVAGGDTLYRIAKKYGHSVNEIIAWNDLQPPYSLSIGQKLQVSKSSTLHKQNSAPEQQSHAPESLPQQTPKNQSLITNYRVHVRSTSNSSASLIEKLLIGTIVKEVGRSENQDTVDSTKDYWYKIEIEPGRQGWIFGKQFVPFEANQRAKHYQQISQTQSEKSLSLLNQMELTDFLARAKNEVQIPVEIIAELALSHLLSLQKTIKQIEATQALPPHYRWLEKQQQQYLIYFNEDRDAWLINSPVFWNLHDKYYPLPISDRIAWAGAKNPLGAECENIFECHFGQIYDTSVKYLKFHPTGNSVGEALDKIAKFIGSYRDDAVVVDEDLELARKITILRAIVARTTDPKKAELLSQIDKLKQLIESKVQNGTYALTN